MTVEVPQIQLLCRWVPVLFHGGGDQRFIDSVDEPVVMLSVAYVARVAFTWTLDYFSELVSGRHFPWCSVSVYGAFRSISHTVFVMFAVAQFALGNLDFYSL